MTVVLRPGPLHGTTEFGGDLGCLLSVGGCGVVFKLRRDGTEAAWYSFHGNNGFSPSAGLLADSAGNLYGTTSAGGSGCGAHGCGVVFKLSPPVPPATKWTETVLYSFGGNDDGEC